MQLYAKRIVIKLHKILNFIYYLYEIKFIGNLAYEITSKSANVC